MWGDFFNRRDKKAAGPGLLSEADRTFTAEETQRAAKQQLMEQLKQRKELWQKMDALEQEQRRAWSQALPEITSRYNIKVANSTPVVFEKEDEYQARNCTIESLRNALTQIDADITQTLTESTCLLGDDDLLLQYQQQALSTEVVQAVVNAIAACPDKRKTIKALTMGYNNIEIPEQGPLDRFQSGLSRLIKH